MFNKANQGFVYRCAAVDGLDMFLINHYKAMKRLRINKIVTPK